MEILLQHIPNLKGSAKRPYLSIDAATSLISVETDTDGLIYTDIWRDSIDSLLIRRMKRSSIVGYSPHNFGLSIDLDVTQILNQKKIKYEDLLWLMKRRGWYCFRRDGVEGQTGSDHFNFLGDDADKYLIRSTQDPTTWQTASDFKIWELYNKDFKFDIEEVQNKLKSLKMFSGSFTGTTDLYTREAILAFQRTWDLSQTGSADITLQRVLAFITADIVIKNHDVMAP